MFELLKTKPHNSHHLQRYIKFIQWCRSINSLDTDEYREIHHIAPKAADLFPEERDNPENLISLTARQHIVAHVMLWKAYGGSQSLALECMLGNFNSDTNKNLKGRRVPLSIKIRYLAKAREEAAKRKGDFHRNKATYKDSDGKKYYLNSEDPLIRELKLVGYRLGDKFTEEQKESLRGQRFVTLYFKGSTEKRRFKINDPKVEEHIKLGWVAEKDEEWVEEERLKARQRQIDRAREANTGTASMFYPDGTFYGRIPKDSPIIKELGLSYRASEKQIAQNKSRIDLATKAKVGTNIWNNGTKELFSKECPGEGWVKGRLPRNVNWANNHSSSVSATIKGSTTWNDGTRNYRLKAGEVPEAHWVRGMCKQKTRKAGAQVGMKVYNDGVRNYRISASKHPEAHWVPGMIKR
jgi:hypothetical protein